MQKVATFSNRSEFAGLIINLRGTLARDTIAQQGGPSARHQHDIEAGKEMPITPATIAKYCTVFGQDNGAVASFLRAIAEAFSAEENPLPMPPTINKRLTAEGFCVGIRVVGGDAVRAAALTPPDRTNAFYARAYADLNSGDHSVLRAATTIAHRHHNSPILIPRSSHNLIDYLPLPQLRIGSWRAVAGVPQARFDPLYGIYEFEQALYRADALGAKGAHRTRLAWAILIANADAAQWGRTPMESWNACDTGTAKHSWVEHLHAISEGVGGATEHIEKILTTARQYLLPWSDQWSAGIGFRHAEPGDAPPIITVNVPEAPLEKLAWGQSPAAPQADPIALLRNPEEGGTWPYDDDAMATLPDLIADMGYRALTLSSVPGGEQLTAIGVDGPTYQWVPTSYLGNYGVISTDGTNWIAVQLNTAPLPSAAETK